MQTTSTETAPARGGPAARAVGLTKTLARLVRPRHWVKNAFVPAPAVLAGVFVDAGDAARAPAAAGIFCLAASAIYVFNDLLAAPTDRLHPVKRTARPLASGALSMATGRLVLGVLLAALAA